MKKRAVIKILVDYISDTHIDHHVRFQENQVKWEYNTRKFSEKLFSKNKGEVLIVAGDIGEWNRQSYWFLDEATNYYNKVFIVLGNHDYYLYSKKQSKKYDNDSFKKIEEFKNKLSNNNNIVLLDKGDIKQYKGVRFAGDTMWYYPKSVQDTHFFMFHMPDYQYIKKGTSNNPLELMSELNKKSLKWYKSLKDKKVDVFVSHVPPVNNPASPFSYNECFVTPVPFLISNHWVTGHQHTQHSFNIDNTNIYMNPMGYPRENEFHGVKSFAL